jgi:serine/threonine protein kinase
MTLLKSRLLLGAPIDAGHYGQVFAVTDPVHGEVAVKVLRQNAGESASDWKQRKAGLLKEGQRLSQATHQNVVRVHQLLEKDTEDAMLLVMELCNGSLQSEFEAGPMPLKYV